MEPEVPRVHYPSLRLRRRPSASASSPFDRDVEDQHASPGAVIRVDERNFKRAAFPVSDPVRLPDFQGHDASLVLHARGVVEDEGCGDRGAVDSASAEAAGEAWRFFFFR